MALAATGWGVASASDNPVKSGTYSLFGDADASQATLDPETGDLELGVRLKVSQASTLSAIRFLKAPGDVNTRSVSVWLGGQKVAGAESANESASGWQTVSLASPLALTAGKTYIVSYHAHRYMKTDGFFSQAVKAGPITAPARANGVFTYGNTVPTQTFRATNYWVDAVVSTSASGTGNVTTTSVVPTTSAPTKATTTTTVKATTTTTTALPTTTTTAKPSGSACSNAVNTPGGPDGMGGCWPYEGNTGVPAGVALHNYTGSCTITAANTVIDRKKIDCTLAIKAANVVVTNSQVSAPILVDSDDCAKGYSYSVSDSTIHVSDINYRGLMSCNFTATRVDVSGGQSMAWCESCTIKDSYLHSPLEDKTGTAHNSTVRMAKNALIQHNTLWCAVKSYPRADGQDTSGCSANQTGYSHDGAPPSNSQVIANLYMPTTGGYCAYGGSTTGELSAVADIVFRDNVFKRGTTPSDHGQYVCGFYGAVTSFDSSRPGNQWVNNRWDDGTLLQP